MFSSAYIKHRGFLTKSCMHFNVLNQATYHQTLIFQYQLGWVAPKDY
ncbi:hypothetical protein NVI2019_GHJFPKLH_02267 [Providencia alcalifaciens]|nr:hypothetical protein NVI2019_GHJFPKLH_02267 [Providencia alcalifaciens]